MNPGHDPERILFANEAFYLAFAHKDLTAMEALWSRHAPLVCIHPGWPALTDRREIMASWRRILGNEAQPGIDFYGARAFPAGDVTHVVCYEVLPDGVLVATNAFVAERGEHRLVLHQSGQCAQPPPAPSAPPP